VLAVWGAIITISRQGKANIEIRWRMLIVFFDPLVILKFINISSP